MPSATQSRTSCSELFRAFRQGLIEHADTQGGRTVDLALIGVQLARQQRECRGLAGAIAADQADALRIVNLEGCLTEDDLVAEGQRDLVEADEG